MYYSKLSAKLHIIFKYLSFVAIKNRIFADIFSIHILWALLGCSVLAVTVVFTAIWNGWIGYMPPIDELQNPINRFATQVYSSDGKVLGTWSFNRENRIPVAYNNLSPYLVKALVATEDARFYDHSGIDFIALCRAIVKRGLLLQKSAGGGSWLNSSIPRWLILPPSVLCKSR